jgi:hypothetical protein
LLTDERNQSIRIPFKGAHLRLFALVKVLHTEARPIIDAVPQRTPRDRLVHGLMTRALGWGLSLQKLDEVYDFQAQSVGCRTLLEIAIDLVLLTSMTEPVEKVTVWEDLGLLSDARATIADKGADPGLVAVAQALVNDKEQSLLVALSRLWPTRKKKPLRWTGRQHLADDARAADGACALGLTRMLGQNYARLCSATHGSGDVLSRRLRPEEFPGVSIAALHVSFELLADVMRVVLAYFGLFDSTWEERIDAARMLGSADALRQEFVAIAQSAEEP